MQAANFQQETAALEARCEADRGAKGGVLHWLRLKRYERRALAEQHAWAYALATQRRLYEVGDKANKRLAWLDKRDREQSWVREVQSKDGALCGSKKPIVEDFATYYEEVYTSVTRMSEED
ncbi:hypothetical protein NDU88_003699 [Pleurodeles waltl]|uniref:Uncharacterized protein n=1 Tax=Pleurodeles waltl TaxID=8319 RepID=A0AAV7M5E0_PLEWA|nr:hypothetical protein NDU88_003699 [Pleurodeles waltl]